MALGLRKAKASGVKRTRNSRDTTSYSANANQTVGLKRAKTGPGSRRAPIANSVPDQTTKNPSQYNSHVGSTVGLKGAGRPPAETKRTTTNFDKVSDKISKNTRVQNPHVNFSAGLKGVKKNGAKGTASRSNISRGSSAKNSSNTHGMTGHTQQTRGLTSAPSRGGAKGRSGTTKRATGGRGVAFAGNRRVQTAAKGASNIPAVVRRAASRGPAPTGNKPSFISKVAKILSN